jgi:subtilisin family serine protease
VLCCVLLLVATVPGTGAAARSVAANETSQQRAVVVIFEDDARVNETAITAVGGTVTGGKAVDVVPALFARVHDEAIPRLRAHPDVRRVEYDRPVEVPPVEDDQRAAITTSDAGRETGMSEVVPWGIDRIGARTAAGQVNDTAESNVTVAVLDTGIDYDHEDLDGSVVWGVDVVDGTEYGVDAADDVDGHGTHVAGTIAAQENAVGVVGTSPNVRLYSIQVLGPNGGTISDVVEGLDQALKGPDGTVGTDDDADVISMSLGGQSSTIAEREAIRRATNESVPVIVSAGNNGDGDPDSDEVSYPARYDDAIAVAATDVNDEIPEFSSEGPSIDIAAPGVSTLSTYPNDDYVRFSGTSMAAGHVSGTVAMMIAQDTRDGTRDLTVEDLEAQLAATTVDVGPSGSDNLSGAGLVDSDRAVELAGVQPRIVAEQDDLIANETVAFAVVRGDTGQRTSAVVQVAGSTYSVDENTTARHVFDTAGTYTLTAIVPTGTDYEYVISETVTVSPGDVTGDGAIATNVDDDEQYEDVNGDRVVNVVDVQALFANIDDPVVQANPQSFDFNQDGTVNVVDVQRLFAELSEPSE